MDRMDKIIHLANEVVACRNNLTTHEPNVSVDILTRDALLIVLMEYVPRISHKEIYGIEDWMLRMGCSALDAAEAGVVLMEQRERQAEELKALMCDLGTLDDTYEPHDWRQS